MSQLTQTQMAAGFPPFRLARAAAVSSVALGAVVLAGWWLNVPALQSGWPRGLRLPVNGALIFVLLGVALDSRIPRAKPNRLTWVYGAAGQAAALLVAAVGLVTLLEYLFGRNFGIDEWLWKDRLATVHHAIPGRLAFPTALDALCLGLGLALLDVRLRRAWPGQIMAVLSVQIAFLALIGYACNVSEFYGQVSPYPGTGLPVPAVAVFLFLGIGLLGQRPERGLMAVLWSYTPGGMLARWLMLVPAVGLLLTGVVYLSLTRWIHADHAVRTWALGLSNLIFVTVPIWVAAQALHRVGLERDRAHQALEQRVKQRTAELTEANAALLAEVAERTEAQKALRDARDRLEGQAAELERKVAERTAKLGETIGDLESFSYSIAHDMRAPLRGMHGFARLLLQDHASHLDAEGRDYLERIASSAARMDILIQDAVNYTQVLRTETRLRPIELDGLVRQLVQRFPGWQLPLAEVEVIGELRAVVGQEDLIIQCVSNLVANAVKFVPHGTVPQVRIWTESLEANVRLWVEDNGIGIDPKDHDRIFRMFERLNRAEQYEGTGIGLAVVRKSVARMGGQVDFRSAPGKGSQFWIELKKAPQA